MVLLGTIVIMVLGRLLRSTALACRSPSQKCIEDWISLKLSQSKSSCLGCHPEEGEATPGSCSSGEGRLLSRTQLCQVLRNGLQYSLNALSQRHRSKLAMDPL